MARDTRTLAVLRRASKAPVPAALLCLALAACGGTGGNPAPECRPAAASPAHRSSGGVALPPDFPADVHLPTADYTIVSVHQETELRFRSGTDSYTLFAEINAAMASAGWSGSVQPVAGGPGAAAGNFIKGCRAVHVEVGDIPWEAGALLLIKGSDNLYPECGFDNNYKGRYPFAGEFTMAGGFPKDVHLPASATRTGTNLQTTSVEIRTSAPLPAVFAEYTDAMRAACWNAAVPNQKVQGSQGNASFIKGERFVAAGMTSQGSDFKPIDGTRIFLTFMPVKKGSPR
jgi:hypothetical protein